MARPKKTETRDCQLNLHLTRIEIEAVRLRASSAGLRVADYGRALVLDVRRAEPLIVARPRVEIAFVLELRRLGNNLNQVARRLNSAPVPMLPASLEPLLRDIRALIERELRQP
jgi:hypothetical protein